MKLFYAFLFGLIPVMLLPASAQDTPTSSMTDHGYTLEFYTGKWCGACYRVKAHLRADNSSDAITLRLADGTIMTIPIVEVDVPGSYDESRYAAGATDIYGRPRIPQFQVKRDGKRTDAFIFPWPTNRYGRRTTPPDFSAATVLGTRLAIGLKLEANVVIPKAMD